MHTVGVIGNGYVGQAVAVGFSSVTDVKVWDKQEGRSPHTVDDVADQDIIFICVPTPTDKSGHSNTQLASVIEALGHVKRYRRQKDPPVIAMKSTVLPGSCDRLSESLQLPIVSNPEFLSARTAVDDFLNPTSIVMGSEDIIALTTLYGLYRERFPDAPILVFESAKTAELIKYARNGFSAVKMAFLNEVAALCRHLNIDYEAVKDGFLASGWVNPIHCEVPGHDGKFGFGGACLPKDGRALVRFGYEERSPMQVLEAALKSNERIRHGD